MRINKFQQGGGTGFNFTQFQPVTGGQPAQQNVGLASPSAKETEEDDDEKDMNKFLDKAFEELGGAGLKSDVNALYNDVMLFMDDPRNVSESHRRRNMAKIYQKVNHAKRAAAVYDTAMTHAQETNSLGDIAINNAGHIYVQTEKGGLDTVSAQEYAKNRNKYRAFTYADLAHLRNDANGLAFNTTIISDIGSSVGTTTIFDAARGIVEDMGTESREFLMTKEGAQTHEILWNMVAGDSSDDSIYKVNKTDSVSANDQRRAIDYLWNNLDAKMQKTITAQAADRGFDVDKGGKYRMLIDILQHHTDSSLTMTARYAGDDEGSGSGAGGKDKYTGMTFAEQVTQHAGHHEVTTFGAGDADYKFDALGMTIEPPMTTRDGNTLKKSNTIEDLVTSNYATAFDFSQTSFAGDNIDVNQLGQLYYNNESWHVVDLPYKMERGKASPDFELLDRFGEYQDWAKENPDLNEDKIARDEAMYNFGLNPDNVVFDKENNLWKLTDVMSFGITYGYASRKDMDLDKNKYMSDVDKDVFNAEQVESRITNNEYDTGHSYKNIVRSMIAVPSWDARTATHMGGRRQEVPESTVRESLGAMYNLGDGVIKNIDEM